MEAAIAVLVSFVTVLVAVVCLLCVCSRMHCCCGCLPNSTLGCDDCCDQEEEDGDGMDIVDSDHYAGVDNIDVEDGREDDDESDETYENSRENFGYTDADRCEVYYEEDGYYEEEEFSKIEEVEYIPDCHLCESATLEMGDEEDENGTIVTKESVV